MKINANLVYYFVLFVVSHQLTRVNAGYDFYKLSIGPILEYLKMHNKTLPQFEGNQYSWNKSISVMNISDEDSSDCECTESTLLSDFVQNYNLTQLLPDDYEQLTESVQRHENIFHTIHHFNQTIERVERLIGYQAKLTTNADLRKTLTYLVLALGEKFSSIDLSTECMAELSLLMNGLNNGEVWPLKFFDSFGSVHLSGLFGGRLGSFGEFDQCVGIKKLIEGDTANRIVYGRYCQVKMQRWTQPMASYSEHSEAILRQHPMFDIFKGALKQANMHNLISDKIELVKLGIMWEEHLNLTHMVYGVCFPASCTPLDIENVFNLIVYPFAKYPLKVDESLCDTHPDLRQLKLDSFQKVSIVCLTTALSIVFLCTLYHIFHLQCTEKVDTPQNILNGVTGQKTENSNSVVFDHAKDDFNFSLHQVIMAFSALKNTKKIFNTEDSRFACVDTLRVILTFAIFAGQEFAMSAISSPQMIRNYVGTYSVQIGLTYSDRYWFVRTPGLWNDGMMVLFGMVLVPQQFRQLANSNGKFCYFTYVWKRWYRLSITMTGILFFIYLLPLTGDGPMWHFNEQMTVKECRRVQSLASTFLYYSNLNIPLADYEVYGMPICNFPTWFVSMSTQLYLICPVFFLSVFRWPRFGLALMVCFLLVSPIFSALPRIVTGYPTYYEAFKFNSIKAGIQAIFNYHHSPSMYVNSLATGLLVGYLAKAKPNLYLGGRLVERALWLVSFASVAAIFVWSNTFFQDITIAPDTVEVMAWWVLSKLVFSSFIGYTCYMCCTGRGGLVNRCLTLSCLQPFAKLSYGIYLMRTITIFARITSIRHPYEMYFYQTLQNTFFDFMHTAVMAYLLYILFEAPSMTIMKLLERSSPKPSNEQLKLNEVESSADNAAQS